MSVVLLGRRRTAPALSGLGRPAELSGPLLTVASEGHQALLTLTTPIATLGCSSRSNLWLLAEWPWLSRNADRLAEALGIELEFEDTERAVGGYCLDIIRKVQTKRQARHPSWGPRHGHRSLTSGQVGDLGSGGGADGSRWRPLPGSGLGGAG